MGPTPAPVIRAPPLKVAARGFQEYGPLVVALKPGPVPLRAALPLLACLASSGARAQSVGPAPPVGAEFERVTLGAGHLIITVPTVINLGSERITKPINIPLDLTYGVNDDVTLGLSHSFGTVQGVEPYGALLRAEPDGRVQGICLTTGSDSGCARTYNNVSFDTIARVLRGTIQIAGHGGFDYRSVGDGFFALRAGVLAKAPFADAVSIITDPRIVIGLNRRGAGNREWFTFPLAIQAATASGIRFAASTGVDGPLASFSEIYSGWLGVLGAIGINEKVEAFASFTLPRCYGPGHSLDHRTLAVGFNITVF